MAFSIRNLFPYAALALVAAALYWATNFSALPPADFTFANGTDPQSLDPAKVTGIPDGRIINGILEGLYSLLPSEDDPNSLTPQPALALEAPQISDDLRTYTIKLRENAVWTNGDPVTAHDFVWSWQRFLHPETASQYAYQLHYVTGAKAYNYAEVKMGDRVEIELPDRRSEFQPFPRGTMLAGIVKQMSPAKVEELPETQAALKKAGANDFEELPEEERDNLNAKWRQTRVMDVELRNAVAGVTDWNSEPEASASSVGGNGGIARFTLTKPTEAMEKEGVRHAKSILPHFSTVGIRALDDHTLEIELNNPTPYFLHLLAFYPLFPVNRRCVEEHGFPRWTKPENIVTNGPYTLEYRRLRDRIRLKKSPTYWDRDNVYVETIDALPVQSETTQLNLYWNGQIDWMTQVPTAVAPDLKRGYPDEFRSGPMNGVYFFRFNVTRKPFDDPRVRRALSMAIDRQSIVESVSRLGETPAFTLCPPGLSGYEPPDGIGYNPAEARRLLAEAGYPGGKGFPKIQVMYNTADVHREIAEVLQHQWGRELGIDVEPKSLEWAAYLDAQQTLTFQVCRAGWVGDYPDPNTFLNMFMSKNKNNQTGWKNEQYDRLMEAAESEPDVAARHELLRRAEAILIAESPVAPVYFYVSKNIVRPYVEGFNSNPDDTHPFKMLRINRELKERAASKSLERAE